jgi:hypothetical protein
MAMASRENESDRRCLGKHEADRVDQLSDPFSLHESSAEKHNRRVPVLVFRLRRDVDVLDSIPNDSDALVDPRAVLLQQLALTPSQGDHAIGVADQSFLPYPLRHTFRRALSELVFGTI